ncbi:hypothetical protein [Kitasatospora sp. NPDC088779]|uniref:hypothetical protein n=1 Tax=Kitasatospora sp. NPDC088779 TaxID=3154964 RepID=UPI00342D26FF
MRIAAYNSSLSHPDSWTGHADGTATSKLASGAVLRFQPAHKDLHTSASRGWDERYDLIVDHQQIKIESVAQLHELLKKLAAGQSTNEAEADAVDPLGDGDDRTEPLVYEDDDQWADAETGEDPQWDTVEAI